MTKQELITDIKSKVLKVILIVEEADTAKNAAGVRMYLANVLEQKGETCVGANKGFYVVDEGLPTERAYYREQVSRKNVVLDAAIAYADSLVPATFIKTFVQSSTVNEEKLFAEAIAYKDNGDGTCTKSLILIFKNGASPIAHKVLK